jgi:prepilin-type N-terminal cleavage/methylation domain-containing protein
MITNSVQNRLFNYSSLGQRQRGFSILESMIAIALLGLFTISFVNFKALNNQKKDAKVLSEETLNYAVAFARYMNNNQDTLKSQAINNPVVLSPNAIGINWPVDLAKENLFHQTPCLAIVTNPNTSNLEAIMYYVGGNSNTIAKNLQIVRDGSIFLGSKGGILLNGAILGNSGWQINSGSPFLSGALQCGGALSDNSLAVNLDLFLDWNQNLQPNNSILRGLDRTTGVQSLPGHIKNANTAKSNLYFGQNNGVVLDSSNQSNPTKLSVLYDGQGTGAATIGVGNTKIASLVGDTFKPNLQFQAGQYCTSQELGKAVLDQGLNNSASSYLARGTLVCTQNDMLCGNGNYCYLSSIANSIVFQNTIKGIQDTNGNFYCPADVPFATSYTLSNTSGQTYIFMNRDSNNVPNSINVISQTPSGKVSDWTSWSCPGCGQYFMTDFKNARDRNELLQVDLGSITGSPVGTTVTTSGVRTIDGSIGQYSVIRGYSVKTGPTSCDNICSGISGVAGHNWQALGTQRYIRTGLDLPIQNQNLGCACERTDFAGMNPDNYNGVAAVIGNFTAKITSVTCTNASIYTSN